MAIAVILAGGYGSRFGALTQDTPKALLKIAGGVTILDRQLAQLKTAGIKEVRIATGHLGDRIKAKYGKSWKGLKIGYTTEETPQGSLWAARENLNQIKGDAVLMNGDWVSSVDIKAFVKHAQKSKYPVTMFLTKLKSPYGIVRFEGDRITEFVEKPFLDEYINGGLYYIKAEAFRHFEMTYVGTNLETTVFPLLAEKGLMGCWLDNGAFHVSVDTAKDLKEARKVLAEGNDNTEQGAGKA